MNDVELNLAGGACRGHASRAVVCQAQPGRRDGATLRLDHVHLGSPPRHSTFSGNVEVRLNTDDGVRTIGGVEIVPGISVRATNITLDIFGQTLQGDFAFEQVNLPLSPQAPPGAVAPKALRIVANNVTLSIQAGGADVVKLEHGSRLLPADACRHRRSHRRHGHRRPPGRRRQRLRRERQLRVVLNNTTAPVSEQFELNGQTVTLDVPAGPFLRVMGTNVQLRLFGQRLSGNFGFEQATQACTPTPTCTPTKVVRIAATNVTLALGDGTTDYVRLTNGTAFLVCCRPPGH